MKNHRLINKKDIENNLSELRNIVFEATVFNLNASCSFHNYIAIEILSMLSSSPAFAS